MPFFIGISFTERHPIEPVVGPSTAEAPQSNEELKGADVLHDKRLRIHVGYVTVKKVKRRKTLPATTPIDIEDETPPPSIRSGMYSNFWTVHEIHGALVAATETALPEDHANPPAQDSPESASTRKSKRDRKKSLPAPSSSGKLLG